METITDSLGREWVNTHRTPEPRFGVSEIFAHKAADGEIIWSHANLIQGDVGANL